MSDSNILHRLRELGEHHELAYEAASEIESLRFRVRELTTATSPLAAAVLQQEAGEPVALPALRRAMQTLCDNVGRRQGAEQVREGIQRAMYDLHIAHTALATQAVKVPLTDEEIRTALDEAKVPEIDGVDDDYDFQVWRACERAHLIGLGTKGDGNG